MPVTKLSQVLRKFRRSQGITLIDMTAAIGYPPSEFSAIVSGARGPKSLRLLVGRIVAYFDLTDEEKTEIRMAARTMGDAPLLLPAQHLPQSDAQTSTPMQHLMQALAVPEEPMFMLKGGDPFAPITLKIWALMYRHYITAGLLPSTHEADVRISDAYRITTEMEIFGREQQAKQELARTTLDDKGYAIARDGVPLDRGKKGA